MKYLFFVFASLLLLSCSEEQILNPSLSPLDETTIGVRSKVFYPNLKSNQILSIEDFKYNNKGKLQKKIYYGGNREMIYHFELFNYDNNENLIYKLNYHNNINSPTGFILLDSTTYFYSGGLLASEKINFPYANYYEKYNYDYGGKYLIKKTKYRNEELDSYFIYEYKNGKMCNEINYYKDGSVIESKEYKYYDNVLVEIVYYTFKNEAKRRVNYSYNRNGMLILEKVDELLAYSSSLPYVVKYIY